MAQSDNKVLILGALAGVAGLGLAVACYQGYTLHRRRHSMPAHALRTPSSDLVSGLMLADGPGGLPRAQVEVLNRLEALIQCVSELKEEMKALKTAIPTLQVAVRDELRGPETRRVSPLHRPAPGRRKRATTAAVSADRSSEEAESEGGYITALTDSDEDEEEAVTERRGGEERPLLDQTLSLFERVDRLHQGSECDKRESLSLLLQHREQLGQNSSFLWRLTRAYSDVHDFCSTLEEKKQQAEEGKRVGEEAVQLNPTCADSHQWYAIMCGIMAEYDTVQNKIKNGYIFKDHLDKAIELKPHDPLSYYLMGRWCYAVAQLSWLERKVAATLFGEPPSATVEDALRNFLKVEEIQPGYSKLNYVYLAKCYRDLGQQERARRMCEAANSAQAELKEALEAQKELDVLCPALGV
ncbi:regulator of microtubule dynamics protein 2 [Periophthalmus magnuspinnatus]|uniref:regulator of microtubule dynamics protein 2 n=1 Tax=Periophthalmus magnuspinnatus TaxID=409849 RepID=UPI0024367A64|nr:regulator of microtubule dynamics protein 2 [Periophthalmus magnuspinnatus]XP_055083239.1 regulator of microtubule dynamics protein 2 [Periophthalmus magnuspinnatus]